MFYFLFCLHFYKIAQWSVLHGWVTSAVERMRFVLLFSLRYNHPPEFREWRSRSQSGASRNNRNTCALNNRDWHEKTNTDTYIYKHDQHLFLHLCSYILVFYLVFITNCGIFLPSKSTIELKTGCLLEVHFSKLKQQNNFSSLATVIRLYAELCLGRHHVT